MSRIEPARRAPLERLLAPLLLVLLGATAYHQASSLGFVEFDDPGYVSRNPQVLAGLTGEGVGWAFRATDLANWHPLTWLSHMLVVEVFGPEPGPHHVANVALHLVCVVLLFRLLVATTGRGGRAFTVAALFAVHPLHVESVAWIAERKDVLSTAFWLATMLAWVAWTRRRTPLRYGACCALLVCGLMSKPMLVTLPFVLLLFDVWPLGRWSGAPGEAGEAGTGLPMSRLVREKLPLFAIALGFAALAFAIQRSMGAVGSTLEFTLAERVANALRAGAIYLRQTVWPTDLAIFYPYPAEIRWGSTLAGALALVAITLVALRRFTSNPALLCGWLWFLGTLVPVIGLVQVGNQAHADRYTYVPHIGLFVAAVWVAADGARRLRAPRWLAPGSAALVVLGLWFATRVQVGHWKDDLTLFRHALAVTEDNFMAHDHLGVHHRRAGELEEAERHLRASIAIRPDLATSHNNLGKLLLATQRLEEAVASYDRAVELEPDFALAYSNRGAALGMLGRHTRAVESLERALELDPELASAHLNLAITLHNQSRLDEAAGHYREVLRLEPENATARENLSVLERQRGRTPSAAGD